MLQRLYIHNYRCLENFELRLEKTPSALLIGKNGTGKSTVGRALEVFQGIGRGTYGVGLLVKKKDFARQRYDVPIRFEMDALLGGKPFQYSLAFQLPRDSEDLRVFAEKLVVSGETVYSREEALIKLRDAGQNKEVEFMVDWRLAALPVIQERSAQDPIHVFKTWLARMIVLDPIPSLMTGESDSESLGPRRDGSNFGEWLSGLLLRYPASYTLIDEYLRKVMPDIKDFRNELRGERYKSLLVRFEENLADLTVSFRDLSDGEKCFFLCAAVLAANRSYGPIFCFWDEPDNHLSLSETGHFVTALRRTFETGGQFVATSHDAEAIRKFSDENTFALFRRSHLEPTLIRRLDQTAFEGDLVDALIRDDLEP